MLQGTGSGVGKSLLCAGLCRLLARRGYRVAPFKAQNMALNSAVTPEGLEIGRAQAYQAEAAGILPEARMNPILLKPTADATSQVIIMGRPAGNLNARSYYQRFQEHWELVRRAYDSLENDYEVIVIEGAGSPAEINLQEHEIVNMRMAAYARASVFIVGDIDRGGVFAWLKGTYDLIPTGYRDLVKGFIINKFRGDVSLLEPALEMFARVVSVPIIGVIPYVNGLIADEEDGVYVRGNVSQEAEVRIVVIRLPRLANFTDFLPLALEPDVSLEYVTSPEDLSGADLIIIPGTKATISDLLWLKENELDKAIVQAAQSGKMVIGICGGYQMLGERIRDPEALEAQVPEAQGLGLLPLETFFEPTKVLCSLEARLTMAPFSYQGLIRGYEIHMGRSRPLKDIDPLFPERPDLGCWRQEPFVFGTYLHGLFDNDQLRRAIINRLRSAKGLAPQKERLNYAELRMEEFDRLADLIEKNLDTEKLLNFLKTG